MLRLRYQIKNISKDKLCILTFLLPIIVGIAVNLLSDLSFQSVSEISFGSVQNDLSKEAAAWLQRSGTLTQYQTIDELEAAVNNPSTQMIGVLSSGTGIRTVLSGDEFELYKTIGECLTQLYDNRTDKTLIKTVIPMPEDSGGMKTLFIAITLITAMFMGCTFNAMDLISEKESGVALIHQILPMTTKTYIVQKLLLGFIGGAVSTIITALICMRIDTHQVILFVILILLSAFLASLTGLFVGHFASGLMIGIMYIKMIMILFLAPPILFYLMIPPDSMIYPLSYLLPSSVTFYGVADLLNGETKNMLLYIMILFGHAVLWSCAYFLLRVRTKK